MTHLCSESEPVISLWVGGRKEWLKGKMVTADRGRVEGMSYTVAGIDGMTCTS